MSADEQERGDPDPTSATDLTTFHVRRALGGHEASLSWLITRFTPVLLAQARYRLRQSVGRAYDPSDLVQDVWATALPRLAELPPRAGRSTPVVMKFLSTTLLHHYNNLAKKLIRRGEITVDPRSTGSLAAESMDGLPADTLGVVTRVVRDEAREAVLRAIDELGDADREIVVLRGIEQNPLAAIAAMLSITENAVSIRYHRALKKLRDRLAQSIFDEFPEG